jgi:hypothetical protein
MKPEREDFGTRPSCGHNDMPGKGPERETDPNTTYREYLSRYVDEARAAGAKPILVTSMTRRNFSGGKIKSDLVPYVAAGLESRGGPLKGFAICGADKKFHPAQAEITGKDSVSVSCPEVKEPLAVRYAWEPFPDRNLFNRDGLPASLRTDDFATEESK